MYLGTGQLHKHPLYSLQLLLPVHEEETEVPPGEGSRWLSHRATKLRPEHSTALNNNSNNAMTHAAIIAPALQIRL